MVLFNSRVDFGPLREGTTLNSTSHEVPFHTTMRTLNSTSHDVPLGIHNVGIGGYPARNPYRLDNVYDGNLGSIELDVRSQKNRSIG